MENICKSVFLVLTLGLFAGTACIPLPNETEVARSDSFHETAVTVSCSIPNCINCVDGRCLKCISSHVLFNGRCQVPNQEDLEYLVSYLDIDDSSITASSVYGINSPALYDEHKPQRLRIDRYFDPACAWAAGVGDTQPWVQFDMGLDVTVWGVIMKSRCDAPHQRVTSFQVARSEDGVAWCDVSGAITATYSADGNFISWLRKATRARYWRIKVLKWENHASMKADLIGQVYTSATSPEPKDCSDILSFGNTKSGVYTVYAGPYQKPVEVYCDQKTDGGGWLVFQRRHDGHENFYRGWADYDKGFGDLFGEFWLGNHFLNLISEQDDYTLRVDLEEFTGGTAYAQYSHFSVGTPFLKYPITVSGYDDDSTAGDSLTYHAGMKFSTHDQDNDVHSTNCASVYNSGWWFRGCHHSNLNGPYLGGPVTDRWKGVQWRAWKGDDYSLKTTEMKIRLFGMRDITE